MTDFCNIKAAADRLYRGLSPTDGELALIIQNDNPEADDYLFSLADKRRRERYGTDVFIRGLIEVSSFCKNNCRYCGIAAGCKSAVRYRLCKEDILACCRNGYEIGFRTFVLQGGEDPHFTDDILCDIVSSIKGEFPDCAVTLSLGERTEDSYRRLFLAGADRYLLRHETANRAHYERLHPPGMSFENRIRCLYTLKKIGFQTGAGMMIGSPGQTTATLIEDFRFLAELSPEMVGIGPFIPHDDTPFRDMPRGSLRDTLMAVAVTRLLLPDALIPATTALATIAADGRIRGLSSGANVVMPNLSPPGVRDFYSLYNGKAHTGAESAEKLSRLSDEVSAAGYSVVVSRGDFRGRNG